MVMPDGRSAYTMPSERTHRLYQWWQQAAEKYDYFMAGVAVALTAARDYLLILGFLLLVIARVWQGQSATPLPQIPQG